VAFLDYALHSIAYNTSSNVIINLKDNVISQILCNFEPYTYQHELATGI
jgi:flagellar assembly factor FliW